MSQAIDKLKHEHEAIGLALDVLAAVNQRLQAEEPVELADLQGLVGFLKEFADTCHHGKEEDLLFPALVDAGVALEGGPVGVMLAEHAQGRHWIAAMQAALHPELDVAVFTEALQAYVALLRSHIQKENQILFPLAERLLPESRLQELADAFDAHEVRVMGPGRHEQLHAELKAWKAKYLG